MGRSGRVRKAAAAVIVCTAVALLWPVGLAHGQTRLFLWDNNDDLWITETAPPPMSSFVGNATQEVIIAEIEAGGGVIYGADTSVNTNLHLIDPNSGAILDTLTMTFPPQGNVLTSLEFVSGTLYAGLTSEGGGSTYLSTVDLTTGTVTVIGATGVLSPLGGLAYDVASATMYAISAGGTSAELFTVHLGTGAATSLGLVTLDGGNFNATALEYGSDGVLYSLAYRVSDPLVGHLLVIDPIAVEAFDFGPTGVPTPVSLTWAPPPPDTTLLAWDRLGDDLWRIETAPPPASTLIGAPNPEVIIAEIEAGRGVVFGSDTSVNTNLHLIDPTSGAIFDTLTLTFPAEGNVLTAMEFVGGALYAGLTTEGGGPTYLSTVNLSTGVVSVIGATGFGSPMGGLAFDVSRGLLFGVSAGGTPAELFTIDLGTGAATSVAMLTFGGQSFMASALEFGGDGVLYALSNAADPLNTQLLTVDPVSGMTVDLGPTSIPGPVALTFEPPAPDATLDVWDTAADELWRVETAPPPSGTRIGGSNPYSFMPEIEADFGVIFGSDTGVPNEDLRLIDPATGVVFDSVSLNYPPEGDAITAMEVVHGTLYAGLTSLGGGPHHLAIVDLAGGEVITVGPTGVLPPLGGLAFDPERQTMFGISAGGSPAELLTLDLFTGAATSLGIITLDGQPFTATALEFGADGALYALPARRDPLFGELLTIDPVSALATDLGPTGVPLPVALTANLGVFADGFESGDTSGWSVTVGLAGTCVIFFDDAWTANGQGSNPDTFYAPFGVNFDNTNGYGCIGGMGNGDPGNWDIEGTNGSAAWGLWQGFHAIYFNQPVFAVSLDLLRGHNDYSITLDAYLNGVPVDTETLNLTGPFDAETATFPGPIDEIRWDTVCCYGMDNIVYSGQLTCP